MEEKKVFILKPKHECHFSQWRECVYGAQSWKEKRFLYESMFIPLERWTSILKVIIRYVFLRKPKPQYHLSHQGDCVYDAQSWKEWRLLCESIFIQIERRTPILIMVIREAFLKKPKN